MSIKTRKMKSVLVISLLLISTLSIASAQHGSKLQTSLTRTQVREAQRLLSDMGYWTGAVDGRFDPATQSAVIAFQKWEGRPITGEPADHQRSWRRSRSSCFHGQR